MIHKNKNHTHRKGNNNLKYIEEMKEQTAKDLELDKNRVCRWVRDYRKK